MPRSSSVSEDVWAKAIHAVNVQKMSLRQAAQLYGVHHMSLHRRVRGRYATSMPTGSTFDIREFLSPDEEAEALSVLREQFMHEKRITSDDIRFVVRAIASHNGKRAIPPEFPPSRWVLEFKRAHGFAKLNHVAYPAANYHQQRLGNVEMDDAESSDTSSTYSGRYPVPSFSRNHNESLSSSALQPPTQAAAATQDHAYQSSPDQSSDADREEFGSNASTASYENGSTTAGSTTSNGSDMKAPKAHHNHHPHARWHHTTNNADEKRSYKLSHTVPTETWEKAIAAVEQQGMSLRAAAKAYGVHFAALHRRVKKRAQGEQAQHGASGYFHPDDEAGIIRVVVARAELGVLMTFDELMDLVQRAALRNLPDISVESARKLMTRFQTRNEHAIRHIIMDWPLPRLNNTLRAPAAVRVLNDIRPLRPLPAISTPPGTISTSAPSTPPVPTTRMLSSSTSSSPSLGMVGMPPLRLVSNGNNGPVRPLPSIVRPQSQSLSVSSAAPTAPVSTAPSSQENGKDTTPSSSDPPAMFV